MISDQTTYQEKGNPTPKHRENTNKTEEQFEQKWQKCVCAERPSTATKTSAMTSSAGWQWVGINVIHQPGVLSLCHNTSSKEKTQP